MEGRIQNGLNGRNVRKEKTMVVKKDVQGEADEKKVGIRIEKK